MANDTPISASDDEEQDNVVMLKRLWKAQVLSLLTILENSKPEEIPAAVLNVARQTLADSNITADSLKRMEDELSRLRQHEAVPFDGTPFPADENGSQDFT